MDLQQSWFMHVHLYFDHLALEVAGITTEIAKEMYEMWTTLVQKANELGCVISTDDQ